MAADIHAYDTLTHGVGHTTDQRAESEMYLWHNESDTRRDSDTMNNTYDSQMTPNVRVFPKSYSAIMMCS